MMSIGRALRAWPVAGMLFLSACGGGPANSPEKLPQLTPIVILPPADAVVDTSRHMELARNSRCADLRNRLFVIDNKYVFSDTAGNCADASYSQVLFDGNSIEPLCIAADSIAGPLKRCRDESVRPLFESLLRGLHQPGLGVANRVQEVEILPSVGTPVDFTTVASAANSGVSEAAQMTINDPVILSYIWSTHTAGMAVKPAVPQVDFSKHTVLMLFSGKTVCHEFGLQRIAASHDRLIAHYINNPFTGVYDCIPSDSAHMQMVTIKKTGAMVQFDQFRLDRGSFNTIERSQYSLYGSPARLVIRDAAAFDAMWARHVNGQPDKPVVDFSRNMVVAVFDGPFGSGCESAGIDRVYRQDGKIQVSVVAWLQAPGSTMMCTMAITTPAHLIEIARSDEPVVFSRQTRY